MRHTSMRRGIDWLIRLAAGLVLAFVGSSGSRAQAPPDVSPWIGERVVTRLGVVLQADGKPVDDDGWGGEEARCRVYKVEGAEGPLFRLVAEGSRVAGWAPAADVVRVDEAVDYITGLIRADPTAAANYVWRGDVQHARYDYKRAHRDFDEAIRLDPGSATAYFNRGDAWSDERDYDKAIADYTEAIRLDPGHATAYTNRGDAWCEMKEYDKAIADYTEAIRLDPEDVDAYSGRGFVRHEKKEYDEAIADFTGVIRLDPKDAFALIRRGAFWCETKDYGKAITDFTEAIRLDAEDAEAFIRRRNEIIPPVPVFPTAYISRGLVWDDKEDYDKALSDFNEAIRLDPKSSTAYFSRGLTWAHKKDYDKALGDFDEAIRLDPGSPAAYDVRAWIWATAPDDKVRDGKRAVESATRACEINGWKTAYDLAVLAAAYAEAGDFDAAVRWQEKAISLLDAPDAATLAAGRTQLDLYRNKKPYRQEPKP